MGEQRAGTCPPRCSAMLVHVIAPVWARASTSPVSALWCCRSELGGWLGTIVETAELLETPVSSAFSHVPSGVGASTL